MFLKSMPPCLLSFLPLTSKYQPWGFCHLNLYVTFTVLDLSVPLTAMSSKTRHFKNVALVVGPLPLTDDTLSWLRKCRLSGCLLGCHGVLQPRASLNPSRLCVGVTSFHLLAPLSLQPVKQQPLTNPTVILENSLLAGAK